MTRFDWNFAAWADNATRFRDEYRGRLCEIVPDRPAVLRPTDELVICAARTKMKVTGWEPTISPDLAIDDMPSH